MSSSGLPLETLAADIKARLNKGNDYLISAAIGLAEARERVVAGEAPGYSWEPWCLEFLGRTADEAQRLIGYVRSGDLEGKLAKRREQKRQAQQRQRAKQRSGPRGPGASASDLRNADGIARAAPPTDSDTRNYLEQEAEIGEDEKRKLGFIAYLFAKPSKRFLSPEQMWATIHALRDPRKVAHIAHVLKTKWLPLAEEARREEKGRQKAKFEQRFACAAERHAARAAERAKRRAERKAMEAKP